MLDDSLLASTTHAIFDDDGIARFERIHVSSVVVVVTWGSSVSSRTGGV